MIDLAIINGSKLFWGIALVLMNMGSRYVLGDLTRVHESLLMSELFKKVVLFCMFFIGSRDVLISLILTFGFSILLHGLFNEKSKYSLVPANLIEYTNKRSPVAKGDYERAKEIVKLFEASDGKGVVDTANTADTAVKKYKELFE